MPSKPKKSKLNATTPEILNAIRSDLSPEYQNAVPLADGNDIHTLYAIGKVIMTFEPHKNAFLNALVNRIAFVRITNQLFYNPWSFFKQGRMENGETVEEVFTQIASPFNFDPEVAESEVFKRVIPDVRAAFHTMNYQQFYKQTISDDQLAQAFLSWSGVSDMIASIVNAIYSAANQDEYLTMKYMIQRAYLDGNIKTVTIPTLNSDNIKTSVSQVKALSNTLTFMSDQYNAAGVTTFTPNTDQIVLLDTLADALIDVELLAGAFNLPYANLLQQRILVDSFTTNDYTRLAKLFANDPTYKPFTQEEVAKLQKIQMCVLDKGWFMIFDNLEKFTEQYNAQGLYWNYFFHVWKTFSYSPFKNAVMLVSDGSGVTGLTVTPDSATIERGESANFTVTATGSTTTPDVVWSLSDTHPEPGIASLVPLLSTITQDGIVTIAENEPNDTLYAIATLKSDPTIIGYSVITVTPEPTITSISISPVTAIMAPGDSREFTATVQGSSTANLGYYMNISGNTSPSTLISPSGSLTLGSDEKATSITVTATSVQDHSFTAIALVTVTQPERGGIVINGLEVQSKAIEVTAGQEVTPLTLTANVTGLTDKTVTWTLPNPAPGITMTESSDTITMSVDFTESSMVSGTYKITAANVQGMTADYYLQIAVPPAIIITPATQTITDAGSVTYTVTPYGITSPNYTWEVQGNPAGITMANGVVTVDATATNGNYTVLCQETTENVGAEANIVVNFPPAITTIQVLPDTRVPSTMAVVVSSPNQTNLTIESGVTLLQDVAGAGTSSAELIRADTRVFAFIVKPANNVPSANIELSAGNASYNTAYAKFAGAGGADLTRAAFTSSPTVPYQYRLFWDNSNKRVRFQCFREITNVVGRHSFYIFNTATNTFVFLADVTVNSGDPQPYTFVAESRITEVIPSFATVKGNYLFMVAVYQNSVTVQERYFGIINNA